MKSESGSVAEDGLTIQEILASTKKFGRKLEGVPVVYIDQSLLLPKAEIVRFHTTTPSSRDDDYEQILEFYWVELSREKDRGHQVLVKTKSGKSGYIKKLDRRNYPIAVRCSCQDYRFTWARANQLAGAFTGPKFPAVKVKGTRGPRNPQNMPGVCKHLMGVFKELKDKGYIR
jgi:hypothetical protein